ncbi:MAG: fibronectin type III domain-containing protein [Lachnospiraceae bacterium]|nr:fibronectin type III domain-containing protein [Lachnospiraceae bacterium]
MKKETMKKRGRSGYRNPYLAVILSGTLALTTCLAGSQVKSQAAEGTDTGLHNPTVVMNECDTVYFGSYWQEDTNGDGVADRNDDKTPIRWRILSQDGDDAYVIADQVLDAKPYNEEYTDVTWETCTLRAWLNEEFYNNAFTAEEQRAVIEQTLVNADNEDDDTEGGNDTTDKVYLASIADMGKEDYGFQSDRYFYDQARIGTATAYARSQGAYVNGEMGSWWWLRSPGDYAYCASDVYNDGYVYPNGDYVDDVSGGVRPALHLNLSSPLVHSAEKQEISVKSVSWDTVELGSFDGEPIVWRVLEVSDGNAYLLADRILTKKAFNDEYESITWKDSTLRTWLNGEFYEASFTDAEKSGILSYTYENADNVWYDTEGGEDTQDRITLLSLSDIVRKEYGFPTYYWCEHSARIACDENGPGSWWWLRSPGNFTFSASYVHDDGYVYTYGYRVDHVSGGVRPALHISLSSFPLSKKGSVTVGTSATAPETPTTEAPTTETPKPEIPTTEAPTTETPKPETPTTEAPTTETPKPETPTAEAPTTEAPKSETPATEAPTTESKSTVSAPKKAVIKSLNNKASKKLVVTWKKVSGATGYEVSIATKKNFKSGKKVKNTTKTTYTFTKLKKGKTYYVRVRAFQTGDGGKVYGKYSAVKKLKISK